MKIFARPSMFLKDFTLPPNLWKGQALLDLINPGEDLVDDYRVPLWARVLRVHTMRYVDGLISGTQRNGYGTTDRSQLQCATLNVESFCAATDYALKHGVAFSPSAGFHHAHADRPGGYCTYNGLMIAAASLVPSTKVLIIDGDGHIGDGCLSIIKNNKPACPVTYYSSAGKRASLALQEIAEVLSSQRWGLVMYQAGADACVDDVYGAGTFTKEMLRLRDRLVFKECKTRKIPVVWNLAGGYGAPSISDTLDLHYATWEEAVKVFG